MTVPLTKPQPQTTPEPTPEQVESGFRKVLEDVLDTGKALAPYCASVEEMLSMVELAIKNDAQLRLLLSEVTRPKDAE